MTLRLAVAIALFALATACKKDVAATEPPPPPPPPQGPVPTVVKAEGALHAVRCADVTAEWLGTAPEAPAPLSYGVTGLRFRFADGGVKAFSPKGALEFSDWSFEVFSPDCARAVLLMDRFGPFGVAPLERLPALLDGAAPAVTLQWPAGETARVHSGLRFVSADQVEFQAACCGGVDVMRVSLSDAQQSSVVFSAPEAPHGITRTESGYEVAK
jgi:hypothetical protein